MPEPIVSGQSIDDILQKLESTGLSKYDQGRVVLEWVRDRVDDADRVFAYVEPFPAAVPACLPSAYNPEFEHENWVDGEDLVQAEDANGKRGFNWRFNAIENDLEQLAARINGLAGCVADMRLSLSRRLEEIRSEINYIHAHCAKQESGPVRIPYPNDHYYYDPRPRPWEYTRPEDYTKMIDKYKSPYTYPMGDPREYEFKGLIDVQGTKYTLYQTPSGPVLGDKYTTERTPIFENRGNSLIKKFIAIGVEDAELKALQNNPVEVGALNKKFGSKSIGDGDTLGTVLSALPVGTRYANWGAMVDDFATRVVSVMALDPGYQASVELLKGDQQERALGELDVAMLPGVTPSVATNLKRQGITSVGQLAKADAEKISSVGDRNSKLSPSGAAGLVADAKALTALGGMGQG